MEENAYEICITNLHNFSNAGHGMIREFNVDMIVLKNEEFFVVNIINSKGV